MDQSREAAYQKRMERAPQIKASGLEGYYRALAECNDVVLAGHQTRFGTEFVTWEWVQDHTALWQGHYYGGNYDAAKQDFAVRAGLVRSQQIFSHEQLAEIYRSVQQTLCSDLELTRAQEKTLQSVSDQITELLPDIKERQIQQQNMEQSM